MSRLDSLKIKAKMLQKAKLRKGLKIKLKQAYAILAKSAGYSSWREMKMSIEESSVFRPSGVSLPYWNNLYTDYKEAKEHMTNKQYLLPYEGHYFLCESDYIESLGIDLFDEDLKKVGKDWINPEDVRAFQRLTDKIKSNT